MNTSISPFILLEGKAIEAISYYQSIFSDFESDVECYEEDTEQGKKGSVKRADLHIHGNHLIIIDSSVAHDFSLSPALSLFITCDSDSAIDHWYEKLAVDGKVLMELSDAYDFSEKYAWVQDKFGLSWQLSLDNHS